MIIPNVNANKNIGYPIADAIARFIRCVPSTTRPTFSNATTRFDKFPDVTNNVSFSGTQPRVASGKVIPRSRFFCHSRITIANGSRGFVPLCDSTISNRSSASINVKSLRNSDANFRQIDIRFSVFNRNIIFAYNNSSLFISICPRLVQLPDPAF